MMLPRSSEEARQFYRALVAYAATRRRRPLAADLALRYVEPHHAEIIRKLFNNSQEHYAEIETFLTECVRLVRAQPDAKVLMFPSRADQMPASNRETLSEGKV